MATWRDHEYYEASPTGPNEQYATDASRVLRTLYFPGRPTVEQRQVIAQDFIGYALTKDSADSSKRYIARLTPHFYPARSFDIYPHLYCQSLVHSEMVTADDSEETVLHATGDRTALSEWWKATFEYRSLPGDVREDDAVLAEAGELFIALGAAYPDEGDALRRGWANTRNIAKVVEPGGRVIPLPIGAFRYEGTTVPTREPFPFNETLQNITYFWSGVPLDGYPVRTVQTMFNTVNLGTFDNYPEGTLLLIDDRQVPRKDAFGQRTLDVTYRMLFAPRCNVGLPSPGVPLGHNAILRITPALGVVWWLLNAGDGAAGIDTSKRPFRYTDFSKLFHPDQPP